MKKIFKYTFVLFLGLGLCSCDKMFDSLEGDLTKMSEEDMTSSQAGMEKLLSDVYNTIPMDAFNTKDQNTIFATYSKDCSYSIDVTGFWNYKKMRSINYFIKQVDIALEKNAINQATRDAMLGEAVRGALKGGQRVFGDALVAAVQAEVGKVQTPEGRFLPLGGYSIRCI